MKAPPTVQRALDHVRAQHPEVTHVLYTRWGTWLYVGDDGEMPEFDQQTINVDLLEDAANEVVTTCGFPAVFCVEAP